MKSLVTGGAGFIGNHVVNKLLSCGHDVVVLDNFLRGNKLDKKVMDNMQLIEGDIRDWETVYRASQGCDLIFHFAAILGVDIVADNPVLTMETEMKGIMNLAKAAILNGTEKLIYASTSGVYGKSAIEKAVNEDFSVAPNSSYAIAKRSNEIYLAALFQEKGLASASIRFFNVYGPKQDHRMVIPRFFKQAMEEKPISVFGTGKQTRDFTYIDDVCEAVERISRVDLTSEIINVANTDEFSIHELAKKIIKVTESKSEIALISPPGGRYDFEVERRYGSSEKLKRLTGFSPSTPLEEGLKKTFNYICAKL